MTPPSPDDLAARVKELEAQLAANTNGNGHHPDPRAATIQAFAELTSLPQLERITQRGRDPETARFTVTFADGREIRVGTVKTLWSRAEFSKALAVAIGRIPDPCTPAKWTSAVGALFAHVVEVEEAPDELFEDTVRDWLGTYANRTSTDAQEAAARRLPFTTGGELHVNAGDLAKYVRREYSEQVRLFELRQALSDLGFIQTAIHYERGRGDDKTRTTASYYHAPLANLDIETPA